jgi:DNA-directed RNA polymerase specialized sigma24 family protein
MGVVIIPSDYEQLPEARRRMVVPIYIESNDHHGNPIHPAWFELGVRPIHKRLVNLAGYMLGDRRMVSDIAQPAVHKVWDQHGCSLGENPHRRVWRQAVWESRDLAAGGWRERRGRVIIRTVDQIDRDLSADALNRQDVVAIYHRQILLGAMKKTMQQQGAGEMLLVHELLAAGHNWGEIGKQLGTSAEAVKRRFYRYAKRTFRARA